MTDLSRAVERASGIFGHASVNFRANRALESSSLERPTSLSKTPSSRTLLQLHHLREALEAIKPRRTSRTNSSTAAQAAAATSTSAIRLSSNANTQLNSAEEINTAPTSFQHNGPAWNGSTVTAPWTGDSTASATVGGSYDGSNGQGMLKFEVRRAGTHGEDDLRILVLAPDGSTIENISIDKNDPLNQVYELSNGLTISLGAGDLIKNDTIEVDTTLISTSFTPNDPGWTGSTAAATIGGTYDGSQGTGDLTFQVNRAGTHGQDDLKVRVYDTNDSLVETINIKDNDPIDKVYSLSNGLTFQLSAGDLVKHESFKVSVDASEPNDFTTTPAWEFGSSTATVSGTYDASGGSGGLTFRALDSGVHGQDDLRVRVYNTDGSTLQTIDIDKTDPLNQAYELNNGLSVTFSAGDMIRNEAFTVDVQAAATFSTDPNPVKSTAQPAISGVYDGLLGTDTLTFTVTVAGRHGTDDLSLDVYQSDGSFLETVSIAAADPLDQSYSLSNGLEFSLSAGSLELDETFTLDINHVVPTTVNPNLSFDGSGLNDAKLEHAFTITDGSFAINGTVINVFANDSINSVLGRINAANIDVTAVFDADLDRILLSRNTPGSQNEIILANDTSGFLDATKLSTAVQQVGDGDENSILNSLQIMSSVSSGSLLVNGVSVSFDVNVDSLSNVLSRIEQSVANVSASFDSATGLVSIASTNSDNLNISSGGTGFFQALQVNESFYEYVEGKVGRSRRAGYSSISRRLTIRSMEKFARSINELFDDENRIDADSHLDSIRNDLKAAVREAFQSDSERMDTGIGIGFDFSNPNKGVFGFSAGVQDRFARSIKESGGVRDFHNLFFGESSRDEGLMDRLLEITRAAQHELTAAGGYGIFVDVLA